MRTASAPLLIWSLGHVVCHGMPNQTQPTLRRACLVLQAEYFNKVAEKLHEIQHAVVTLAGGKTIKTGSIWCLCST